MSTRQASIGLRRQLILSGAISSFQARAHTVATKEGEERRQVQGGLRSMRLSDRVKGPHAIVPNNLAHVGSSQPTSVSQ